jgi:small-conductance mechanosensitive channel
MKPAQKVVLALLLTLLIAALAAILLTRKWAHSASQLKVNRSSANYSKDPVNLGALETARQLAPLAVSSDEQEFAQEALRLADKSVDIAFDAALRDAEENPAPLTDQTRELTEHLKQARAEVSTDEERVAQLTDQIAHARAGAKDALQEQLQVAQTQLSLDKDEADDVHQDLIRVGGDKRATVQAQLDRHEASSQHASGATTAAGSAVSHEATTSTSFLAQARAWWSLHTKISLLTQARQKALDRETLLSADHDSLQKLVVQEKTQKQILHRKPSAATFANPTAKSYPVPPAAQPPAPTSAPAAEPAAEPAAPADQQPASGGAAPPTKLNFLVNLSRHQQILSELDQRIDTEQALAADYEGWQSLAVLHQHAFLHGMFRSAFWIFFIALLVFIANFAIQKYFAEITPERRQLHTMRAVILLAVQAFGIILILLVTFGVPGNFATVAALAGAGLTVAMKDFIVAFVGWFVLMGKDGIRAGDWVEINGVGGEVLEVGPLHTVLLETGNWADAAHPTGRKVTFVNSFAIEGHYFNFSTSGQWLWDELQVLVPQTADPYSIAEAIQKTATEETAANAKLAQKEWERVTPGYAKQSFSAAPSLTVRPSGEGVNVMVRYLTRANERQDLRARLYRAVVDLLRQRNIWQTNPPVISPPPADRPT